MIIDQLEKIEKAIARWEEVVFWIEKGWDGEDEYNNDVAARHHVFQLLQTHEGSLPADLHARLDAVDERYRAATVDDWPFYGSNSTSEFDQVQHWYWFRRPEEASIRKAWETSPAFRRFFLACMPASDPADDSN